MKTAFRSACIIMVLGIGMLILSNIRGYTLSQDSEAVAMNKIAPWVTEHTANGAQAVSPVTAQPTRAGALWSSMRGA